MTLYRNHNQAFETLLAKESSKRIIGVDMRLSDTTDGLALTLTDTYGLSACVNLVAEKHLRPILKKRCKQPALSLVNSVVLTLLPAVSVSIRPKRGSYQRQCLMVCAVMRLQR